MDIISGPSSGGEKITVKAAGLKSRGYAAAKCEFYNSGQTIALDNAAITGNKFVITTKVVATPGLSRYDALSTLTQQSTPLAITLLSTIKHQ
jgi:hypothetical protein